MEGERTIARIASTNAGFYDFLNLHFYGLPECRKFARNLALKLLKTSRISNGTWIAYR